ncbi:MAG: helix-turn-helix domain-containing protein [Pseudohongiellaceae bacterium]|nr:helix-turn-helix domain-containing protein [Pseudohongiellaceae bacterium]
MQANSLIEAFRTMVSKNSHQERSQCPIAFALDIIGDHWSLLIIRDLLFQGKHEYKELLESDEGISSNILSDRLKKLQACQLLDVIPHPDSNKRKLYYLTSAGKDLIDVIIDLGRWTSAHLPQEVCVDPNIQRKLDLGRKDFRERMLNELADWEKQYLGRVLPTKLSKT